MEEKQKNLGEFVDLLEKLADETGILTLNSLSKN